MPTRRPSSASSRKSCRRISCCRGLSHTPRASRASSRSVRLTSRQPETSERTGTVTLDYKAIDVDNHYYETTDSCTRHLPKEFKRRGVQMLRDGKRTFAVMGD